MSWTINIMEGFEIDIAMAPRPVQNAYRNNVYPRLRENPINHNDNAIKKLNKWKSMWRYRIADKYRLVYAVNIQEKSVTLILLGKRDEVYNRLGHIRNEGPSAEIIAENDMGDLLETEPTQAEIGQAFLEAAKIEETDMPVGDSDEPLPFQLTSEKLHDWLVPDEHHNTLLECSTEGQLLEAESKGVPNNTLEHVLNCIWPKKLKERLSKPTRVTTDEDSVEDILSGKKSLEEFLLALDETQKPFVNRFKSDDLKGPWLVKGGPGSGKSTVALYCIKELVKSQMNQLTDNPQPIRILFTTYTNALVNASKQLIKHLNIDNNSVSLDVITTNEAARRQLGRWNKRAIKEKMLTEYLVKAISSSEYGYFTEEDSGFLLEEIEDCITGENFNEVTDYIEHARIGRGRALNGNQRKAVWEIYLKFNQALNENNKCLYTQEFQAALQRANGEYDFVFIDEAQDLKPVAIRLCAKLAKDPSHIFLTADSNQSIYFSGFSWKKISDGLDFRGKAVNLKKNYRSTKEIWDGILPILSDIEGADKETLDEKPFRLGELPERIKTNKEESPTVIGEWITKTLLKEKLPLSCAAILCPTNYLCWYIADNLPAELNAKQMESYKLDINHPGIKVMTFHSSKGLQFPVVAVAGLKDGVLPKEVKGGRDPDEAEEKDRRLFFVACSRAINRLLVAGDSGKPSKFLEYLSDEYWEDYE